MSSSTDLSSRAARLRAATHEAHEKLDRRVMESRPFDTRENYARFLRAQLAFHAAVDPLYGAPELIGLLPDAAGLRRLERVRQDLADLEGAAPSPGSQAPPAAGAAEALGWLYTAEGSNLGAAFLLKAAREKLGLSETFGARHLVGDPEGRGLRWKTFVAALDAFPLAPEDEARAIAGAHAAFAFMQNAVERETTCA